VLIAKSGRIEYPTFIDECAVYIGKLRDLYNYDMNEQAQRFKRGGQSEYVNILGVQGELIFSYFLHSKGVQHKMNRLLSNKPVASCDIVMNGKRVDVKTIRTDSNNLLVNKEAHHKNKGVDTYVFIKILDGHRAIFWIFPHADISQWKVMNPGYSEAYYLPVETAGIPEEDQSGDPFQDVLDLNQRRAQEAKRLREGESS